MNSRMDKYTETPNLKSRTEKNKNLYEEIKNSDIDKYDINSNATIIEEDYNVIDVDKIRDMLDKRYRDTMPKRNITLKEDETDSILEKIHDTKEYDINAILEKAKSTQKVDYEKERLKRVHDTQYDILKNLDIKTDEEQNIEETDENIVNLINTITALEMDYKEKKESGNTTALDLLNDLSDNDTSSVYQTLELDKDKIEENLEKTNELDNTIDENYEDFKELEKDLKSNSIAIKIVVLIFVIIILIIAIIFLKRYI